MDQTGDGKSGLTLNNAKNQIEHAKDNPEKDKN